MKKLKKALKVLLIVVVCFMALLYGGVFLGHKALFPVKTADAPTIEAVTNGTLTLGVQAHGTQPTEVEDYITVLAGQLKRYNEAAPSLWPNNALVNQSLIVEQIRKNNFWLIAPDGEVTALSKADALGRGISRMPYADGFSAFDGGMYLAISKEDLTNCLVFQKYLHLGTYDAFITFAHEGFHSEEQPKWQEMSGIPNAARDEFTEKLPARAKRALLQKQLLKAVSEPGNTALILDALTTYADWKISFPEDYRNSVYFDRIEGTAYYFELISSLYAAYPGQIKNRADLDQAVSLLAAREDIYVEYGLVAEGYTAGGFACILLGRLESDWQERLMNDPEATPIEMLLQHFKDEALPAPQQLSQSGIDAIAAEMNQPAENGGAAPLFRLLYDILF